MKKRRLFGVGAAALALAVGITSCQGLLYNNRPGQEIRFSASAANGAETKTEYAGSDEDGGVVNNRERINWKEDGTDQVKIYLFLDNAPDYFFEPGENDEISENAVSDYSVTLIGPGTGDDAYKSRGKLSAIGNTALRWVGIEDNVDVVDHWFYSVYPAKLSGWSVTPEKDNYPTATITFPDLSGQDGSMDYAYMAAVAGPYRTGKVLENQKNKAGTVDLDYYPMVTTVYVTFVNNSTQTTISEIKLTGSQPLVGGYRVKYSGGDGGVLVENSISNSTNSITLTDKAISDAIPFFLIPQEYDATGLSLTINGTTHPLRGAGEASLTLLPFHKYNVIVTINEDGKVEPPTIDDITEIGDAQTILALLSSLLYGGVDENPAFKSYVSEKYPEFSNFYGNNYRNKNPLQVSDLKTLYSKYPDVFQWIFDNVEDLSITTNIGTDFSGKITSTVFKLFANLKTISLLFDHGDATITIEDLPNLTSITLIGNSKVTLTVNDCPSLTNAKKNNNSNTTITVDGKAW